MTLGKRVKKARDAGAAPDRSLSDDERAELERLRAENKQLRMEVDFSREVATWFAKDAR